MGEMQSNKPLNECEWWMLTLKVEMSESPFLEERKSEKGV